MHNLSSNRVKNTYSANNTIFEGRFLNRKIQENPNGESPEYGSGAKLRNYKLINLIEQRNKRIIRPFWLFPDNEQQAQYKNLTRNPYPLEEFSLPDIFSKESILPSTNESDLSVLDDLVSDKSVDDSEDSNQSPFLLKLESTLRHDEAPEDPYMATAYFGTKKKAN